MGAAHPSDLDDRSIQGRNWDEACIDLSSAWGGDMFQPDPRRVVTSERWLLGKEELVGVAKKGPCVREAGNIGMPSKGRRVYRTHQCTFLASADQVWLDSPGEGSLHRHLEVRLSSSRSSDRIHVILLDPTYQFVAKGIRKQ
jgi:hypothetical protein